MSDPDVQHAREALAQLEHLVVQDLFMTETAKYADVVLPASAWPEKDGTVSNTNRQVANFTLFIQNTDPGSNAGVPGVQIPISLGASMKLPVGLEIDGPQRSDRRLIAIGMAMETVFGRLPAPAK
jgi:indoleacetamide hydrolase